MTPKKCPRIERTPVERISNDLNRIVRKYGLRAAGYFLREQGVGGSNPLAPTNVLRELANTLFFPAHEMAHEIGFFRSRK